MLWECTWVLWECIWMLWKHIRLLWELIWLLWEAIWLLWEAIWSLWEASWPLLRPQNVRVAFWKPVGWLPLYDGPFLSSRPTPPAPPPPRPAPNVPLLRSGLVLEREWHFRRPERPDRSPEQLELEVMS